MSTTALALDGVTKRFGAVVALDEATMHVAPGTVHALLGENGAGKTTLMRIAFGMLRPQAGCVMVGGHVVDLASPADAIAHGVAMVHQHFTIVPTMTVADHIALGGHGRYDRRAARERMLAVGRDTGLVLDPDGRAESLPVSALQRLEIVKALATGARVLILDEPTAVLVPSEADDLLRTLRRFADGGGSAIIITHKLREALACADSVTVLRLGRTVLEAPVAAIAERELIEAMLGRAPNAVIRREERNLSSDAPIVIDARDIHVSDEGSVERVRGVTLAVRAGEIIGLAAVEGSGQHELLRALAGIAAPSHGSVERRGDVGFVPEDRHRDALVLDFSLTENVALRGAGSRRGRVAWRDMTRATRELMSQHDVRASGPDVPARSLSGGNQQKLIVARELAGRPAALVVENPTRGLDIAATAAVHSRLLEARDAGAAIVFYSSDLDEVLALADRVVVMHAGELRSAGKNREAIGAAMLGA